MLRHANQIPAVTQAQWYPRRPEALPRPALVRMEQTARGEEACFMTEKRIHCQDTVCTLRARCRRLVAVWKR